MGCSHEIVIWYDEHTSRTETNYGQRKKETVSRVSRQAALRKKPHETTIGFHQATGT